MLAVFAQIPGSRSETSHCPWPQTFICSDLALPYISHTFTTPYFKTLCVFKTSWLGAIVFAPSRKFLALVQHFVYQWSFASEAFLFERPMLKLVINDHSGHGFSPLSLKHLKAQRLHGDLSKPWPFSILQPGPPGILLRLRMGGATAAGLLRSHWSTRSNQSDPADLQMAL